MHCLLKWCVDEVMVNAVQWCETHSYRTRCEGTKSRMFEHEAEDCNGQPSKNKARERKEQLVLIKWSPYPDLSRSWAHCWIMKRKELRGWPPKKPARARLTGACLRQPRGRQTPGPLSPLSPHHTIPAAENASHQGMPTYAMDMLSLRWGVLHITVMRQMTALDTLLQNQPA